MTDGDDLFAPLPRTDGRLADGRFAGGRPVGRSKGRRNNRTLLVEAAFEDEIECVLRAIIDAAKLGDMTAAKIVIERISPKPRGRPVVWSDAPEIDVSTASGRAALLSAIVAATVQGELSPEDAQSLAATLEAVRRNEEFEKLAADVAAIKDRMGITT